MSRRGFLKTAPLIVVLAMVFVTMAPAFAAPAPPTAASTPEAQPAGIFRGVSSAVKFDVSPPLHSIAPIAPDTIKEIREIPELGSIMEGALGPQDADAALQTTYGPSLIPAPSVSFDGPGNISGVSPPDPNGDVGPNHVVVMSNLSFAIYSKTGTLLYGPALNNTLWAGFGGDCQTNNSGDPVVLYDQFSDRWMLSQFTSSGPTYYNCVAISQTPDPTGAYYRYAFSTGNNFPDYPKYGWWSDALYISTREFAGGSTFVGVGAYAIKRSELIAGNPAAQVISFLVPPGAAAYNIGDGLLPADIDGFTLPPGGSPEYYMGSMDDGGSYGAPQDALTLWKFTADFNTPANSSFVLANTIPIAPYDTQPAFCSGRSCVPQPGTANRLDHLGYRGRPMFRLAYRNFGSHESLVTNQSVEASATMSGIRWWEVRSPNSSPVLYQDSTYAPGLQDGIHRWMGSIAMDGAGNMALGYSASSASSTFPSSWYTGRLSSDPLNSMPQGEGAIINGTGSQTGSQRWGDYTSMVVDPVDDCTFWYVNEYVPTTSSVGWQLRIGAFKFNECGSPDFTLSATPASQDICAGTDADYAISVGQVSGFTDPVTLSASGNPAGTTTGFSTNPVIPPGSSTLTIGNTGAAAAGSYNIDVVGVAATSTHTTTVGLNVYDVAPAAPALISPANNANNVSTTPTYSWNDTGASSYTIEIATDSAFSNIVDTATVAGTSYPSGITLNSSTTYYWRVGAGNACGYTASSTYFTFTTEAAPGDCGPGTTPNILYETGFEGGAGGWTSSGTGNTWAIASTNPHSGAQHFHANDPATVSDQRLVSPGVALPTGQDPVILKFWHEPNTEPSGSTACFDGGILEVSTDGGSNWTQVPNADLLVGSYRGTVSGSFGNPLAGLQAWCGETAYIQTIADVSSYAGQTAEFRMRLGTDTSVSAPGWDVDDVTVQSCQPSGGDPNIDINPLSMASTQATNTTTQQNLAVGNTGQADLTWNIFEDVTGAPELVDWSDNFDSYATGSQLIGQGGWEGWDGSAAAGALTSNAQALSAPNSADILGATDLVHQYSGYTSGKWVYTAMQYIPRLRWPDVLHPAQYLRLRQRQCRQLVNPALFRLGDGAGQRRRTRLVLGNEHAAVGHRPVGGDPG
ncbi:MAG: immune inhibitor A [Anaerolineae bacterium]|nr:immune inhibitor A [Anaerolineae bacterium]